MRIEAFSALSGMSVTRHAANWADSVIDPENGPCGSGKGSSNGVPALGFRLLALEKTRILSRSTQEWVCESLKPRVQSQQLSLEPKAITIHSL